MVMSVAVVALIAALIQLVEHWFPWRMVLGKDLPRIPAYVLGVLGFLLPVSGLFWLWQQWLVLAALWAVVAASGLAVGFAYGVDWLINRVRMSYEQEERDGEA